MIYNSDRNFLFIHIHKTGGTSITQALAREQGSVFVSPAHMLRNQLKFAPTNNPFTFAVVRNPWERLVSWWLMMQRKGCHNAFSRYLMAERDNGKKVDFSTFIRRIDIIEETVFELETGQCFPNLEGLDYLEPRIYRKSLAFNQLDYLTDSRKALCCDMIIRFDRLTAEWQKVYEILYSEKEFKPLKLTNANPVREGDWRNFYSDPADREWVAKLYQRDINYFGFCYEEQH